MMVRMLACAETSPTTVLSAPVSSHALALSSATVHFGVAVGSPTMPAGSPIVRSRTWPPVKSMSMTKLLWAPAVVSSGAAVPDTPIACADEGIASAPSAAVSITTRVNRLRPLAALRVIDDGLMPKSVECSPLKSE